jgi:hypothetical protein
LKRGTKEDHENLQLDQSVFLPNANLTKYHEGIYYTGIKLLNNLPPTTTRLNYDIKAFQLALTNCPLTHFYSIDDFASTEKC